MLSFFMQIDLVAAFAMRAVATIGFGALFVAAGVRWPYAHAACMFAVTGAAVVCMELRCRRAFAAVALQRGAMHTGPGPLKLKRMK